MDHILQEKYKIHLYLRKDYSNFIKCTEKKGENDAKCQKLWSNWWINYHVSKKLMLSEKGYDTVSR